MYKYSCRYLENIENKTNLITPSKVDINFFLTVVDDETRMICFNTK